MGKNLQKVQDMLDGNDTGKIQVGMHTTEDVHSGRKVGDKWTDSDGVEWEQKQGYRAKINNLPGVGLFDKQCKDCKTNCSKSSGIKVNNEVFTKFGRCYYCQINFETTLKKHPIKYWAWTRLQDMQRWIAGRKELEQWIFERHEENKTLFDKSVANAMANENLEMSVKKNT